MWRATRHITKIKKKKTKTINGEKVSETKVLVQSRKLKEPDAVERSVIRIICIV